MTVLVATLYVGNINWNVSSMAVWVNLKDLGHFIELWNVQSVDITQLMIHSSEEIEDEYHRLRVMRAIMHGDLYNQRAQGGANTKDNIQTLCVKCHMIKTYKEKDYLGAKQG